jgi:hypothetical protein
MGVDAQMCFILTESLSKDKVRQLALDCYEAFNGGPLWLDHGRRSLGKDDPGVPLEELLKLGRGAHHCITKTNEFHQDGDSILPGEDEHIYEVHLICRYYGVGYERGPLDRILSIARWIRTRLPEARIFYGGDSSGVLADELTEEYEQELWEHFCKHGGKPYHRDRVFGRLYGEDETKNPFCKLCQQHYTQKGGRGGDFAAYHCDGCNHYLVTHDGGKTWKERF